MQRHIKLGAMLLSVAAALCACSLLPAPEQTDDASRALIEARTLYWNASLVITGECVAPAGGANAAADVKISSVIAGNAHAGDTIHCSGAGMEAGALYLLYLTEADAQGSYNALGEPAIIEDGTASFSGKQVPMDVLLADMEKLGSIICAPPFTYYYADLQSLVGACDEAFIGTVKRAPQAAPMPFRSQKSGVSIENTLPASLVTVKTYNGPKCSFAYGTTLTLVYSSAMSADILDAATLGPLSFKESEAPVLLENEVYFFFLNKGPDSKQNHYFPVNIVQGFAPVKGDGILPAYANRALHHYSSLDPLIEDIRLLIG